MNWRGLVLNNFGWKLASLLLAGLVWFTFGSGKKFDLTPNFVVTPTTATRELVAHPVYVMRTGTATNVWRLDPVEVEVTVSGPRNLLRLLSAHDVQAFVTEPRSSVALATNPVRVFVPSGISVSRVLPPRVRLERVESPEAPPTVAKDL